MLYGTLNLSGFISFGGDHFPFLSNSSQTSNHARILRILRELGHPAVTGPHCVPSQLGPLPVLHYDQSGAAVVLTLFQEMVVLSCGCQ